MEVVASCHLLDSGPHGCFSKADCFKLQRQHRCDDQQGSHEGNLKCLLGRQVHFPVARQFYVASAQWKRKRPLEKWKVCGNSQGY